MEEDSDISSFEESSGEDQGQNYGNQNMQQFQKKQAHEDQIKDQHFDEVFELNDDNEEDEISSNPDDDTPQQRMVAAQNQFSSPESDYGQGNMPNQMMQQGGFQGSNFGGRDMNQSDSEDEDNIFQGGYNPADYANLNVTAEVKELFQYIQRYKPQNIELETRLKPFVPEYIPAVGEVDAFLKIPPPSGYDERLGLEVLDEPKLNQSDPALLELKLKSLLRRPGTGAAPTQVHKIENADKNPKQITRWISSIDDVHRSKPPPTISYTSQMPDINDLMDVWPQEMENVFNQIPIPGPDIDLDLHTYATIMCGLLDIPVQKLSNNRGLSEALHMVFTLYSDFKENQHFRNVGEGYQQDYNSMQFQ